MSRSPACPRPRFPLPAALVVALAGCGPLEDPHAQGAPDFAALEQAITADYAAGATLTAASDTRLREGPGTSYDALLTIPAGASVKIAAAGGPTDSFYKVSHGGKTGWVYGRLMRSRTAVYGYYPDARDAFLQLGITSSRVSQTIGYYSASAGTHAPDGSANGVQYSAATDVRTVGLTESQIRSTLESMGRLGFAGWYRKPGYDGWPSSEAPHLHVVFTGAPMKEILRNQVSDWLVGKNGLASHTSYNFYSWSPTAKDTVKRLLGLVPAPAGRDTDADGRLDFVDNCPKVANANQLDTDGDGAGDGCDLDNDNDGVADDKDNCPQHKNPAQADADGDRKGDACDPDDDGDAVADGADNCPLVSNPGQEDADGDGKGDACAADDDGDGVADGADNCAQAANPGQADLDGDGAGDACDPDADGDDVIDVQDNCPGKANASQDDEDQNGVGDACELGGLPPDLQSPPPDPSESVGHGEGEDEAPGERAVGGGCASVPGAFWALGGLALALSRRRR